MTPIYVTIYKVPLGAQVYKAAGEDKNESIITYNMTSKMDLKPLIAKVIPEILCKHTEEVWSIF